MSLNLLHQLNIARKMSLVFGTVIVLCLLLGTVSLVSLSRINATTREMDSYWLPASTQLARIRVHLGDARRQEFNAILCSDRGCLERFISSRQSHLDAVRDEREKFRKITDGREDAQDQALNEEFDRDLASYSPLSEQVMQLVAAGKHDEAVLQLRNVSGPAFDKVVAAIESDIQQHNKGSEEATARADSLYAKVRMTTLILLLAVVLGSVVIGRTLTASIAPPLLEATTVLERIAEKDLTHRIDLDRGDELGRMAVSVNTTIGFFNDVLGTVTDSAESLTTSATELTRNAGASSHSAQELSRQVQQVAAASSEMTATIHEISQNAEHAAAASRNSVQGAEEGGHVMDETEATMNRIANSNQAMTQRIEVLSERSRQIGTVVTVIREISEQTNLLALNAAIEAARAGEQGRGFAVVAGEVRRLAERSGNSAAEITRMISSIQTEMEEMVSVVESGNADVQHGLARVTEARAAVGSIVELARRSEQMVTMIAAAAHEQSSATNEVSETINKIARIASESAASSDLTADACKQLEELAAGLDSLVSEFHLAKG